METQLISNKLHDLVDKDRKSCCLFSLGNKCKEWALEQGHIISSGVRWSKTLTGWCEVVDDTAKDGIAYSICTTSESEAIFKACEWILKQKASHG